MNSTKILFLKMLRGDIKKKACEKMGIDLSQQKDVKDELLTGQTITRSEIESFSTYKLMNDDERNIVESILKKKNNEQSSQRGKAYIKQIDSLVPSSVSDFTEYKDAA